MALVDLLPHHKQHNNVCCQTATMCATQQPSQRMGIWKTGEGNGNNKPPKHKPLKAQQLPQFKLVWVYLMLRGIGCVQLMKCSQESPLYVDSRCFNGRNLFYCSILTSVSPSVSARVIWTPSHPLGSTNSFTNFFLELWLLHRKKMFFSWTVGGKMTHLNSERVTKNRWSLFQYLSNN